MEYLDPISMLVSNVGFPIAMCIILFASLNQERKDHKDAEEKINSTIARVNYVSSVKAIVFDIENKSEPQNIREVALEGHYIDSRMIGCFSSQNVSPVVVFLTPITAAISPA